MAPNNTMLLCVLLICTAAPLASAAWECKDLHADCPSWKQNMVSLSAVATPPRRRVTRPHTNSPPRAPSAIVQKGNCKGVDYQYMLHNCPKTCEMCDEAKEKWEKDEAERRKSPTYEPEDSKVVQLTGDNIEEFLETKGEDNIILVEFYAPWCGHCQHVAPEFREAARQLHAASVAGTLPIPVILAKLDDSDPKNRGYGAGAEHMFNFTSYPSMFLVHGP